ncbi:MAG: DNA methyltransferase [Anaerolineae bacterium]|nr:DNA methyltransferase [Anaerolineae bacterium]
MSSQLPLDRILQGDCREVLADLPAESVDMLFADPPYNLQLSQELRRPNNSKVNAVDDAWDQFDSFAGYDEFTREWLAACRRVLTPTGTLWVIGTYHNIHRVGAILQDLGFWTLNSVVWVKTNPMPNFRGVRFTNAHETLLWVQKQRGASYTFNHHTMKALNGEKQMRSDWEIPLCSGAERIKVNGEKAHSTQKPEALLYRVIQASTNPGDVVLDPFFGSGTTGAVAKRLHRRWIGIEREKKYVKVAQKRIEAIEAGVYTEDVYVTPEPRRMKRIPFSQLLATGLVKPGQKLYLGEKSKQIARILANGRLQYNGHSGSIHQIAKQLKGGPANGWEHWYYRDNGSRYPIDRLRQQVREQLAAEVRNT